MHYSQRYYHKTRACAFAARAVYTGFVSTLIAGTCTLALQTPALAASTTANATTPLTQNSTQSTTLDKPRVSAVSKNVLYDNYLSTHRDYPAAEFTTTLQLSGLKNILSPNNTTLAAEIAQIKKREKPFR